MDVAVSWSFDREIQTEITRRHFPSDTAQQLITKMCRKRRRSKAAHCCRYGSGRKKPTCTSICAPAAIHCAPYNDLYNEGQYNWCLRYIIRTVDLSASKLHLSSLPCQFRLQTWRLYIPSPLYSLPYLVGFFNKNEGLNSVSPALYTCKSIWWHIAVTYLFRSSSPHMFKRGQITPGQRHWSLSEWKKSDTCVCVCFLLDRCRRFRHQLYTSNQLALELHFFRAFFETDSRKTNDT